jgi:hypothetical protein
LLGALQSAAFGYFANEVEESNGLVADKTAPGSPSSIAAVGLALACYPVGVYRGYMSRLRAIERTLATLRFFWNSPQGPEPDATGYQGFYYHFLDMHSGRRVWQCELSTIDTAFLIAGVLLAAQYFRGDSDDEREIRALADQLYRRVNWQWARDGGATLTHGWRPESGFLPHRWQGYDEALILYILALGSPTFSVPPDSYTAWTATYEYVEDYGHHYLYAGPLFTHQLSHLWIDFREIQDEFMRERESDYFTNSRRATYVQQAYAIHNPNNFKGYGPYCWGITASDGPGWLTLTVDGVERRFFDYLARGVPHGPDDGSIAPWVVVGSLPFAPEIVLPTIRHFNRRRPQINHPYGYKATFNETFPGGPRRKYGWVSPYHFGIDQGPVVLMIENYRSGRIWNLMRRCPYIVHGLRRARFSGGWLDRADVDGEIFYKSRV